MLRSGNDAALAIGKYVGGSVDEFVKMMNEKAKKIGMNNTTFNNPSGLDEDKGNYSTAYDMAILTSYAMKLEEYRKIDEDITIKTEFIEREFEEMSELEALDNLYLIDEVEKLEYKRNALIDIISFRIGCVDSILPNDLDYLDIYNKRKRRVRKFRK